VRTKDRNRTADTTMHAMDPADADNKVTTVILAARLSAFLIVEKVEAGLNAKNPQSNEKVAKSSCTGFWILLIGE